MKVECTVEETMVTNARGDDIPSVRVTCSRCGHTASSFGRSDKSISRCFVMLRENCPEGENNLYVIDDSDTKRDERPAWWSEKPPRGTEVETPAILKNLPKRPPGRA